MNKRVFFHDLIQSFTTAVLISLLVLVLLVGIILVSKYASAVTPGDASSGASSSFSITTV